MWLTSISIRRPLFMLMVISALLVIGLVSWRRLGVDLWPALDFPVVSVTTFYPGAGPESVDSLVTRKIEDAVGGMNDIDYIVSSSLEGVSSVTIVFTERASRDTPVDVERRVNAIRHELPVDIRPPSVGKYDPNAQPILRLALSGARDLGQLQRLAEERVKRRLEASSGVGQVTLIGGLEREIQVQVDQHRLQARGISLLQVNQALAADNLNVPAGSLTQQGKDWSIRLNTRAQTPADLGGVLVAATPSGPVFLRDVATILDTYKKVTNLQRSNGQPALGITIVKQASANTIQTVDGVRKVLKQLEQELPADVRLEVVSDASIFIRESLNDVQTELELAIILTGLVLLAFLHTLRSTAIVLLSIPTSLIATLGVMYFLGFSLNLMSLMGLTLTVGILVDDSIVVLENIFRHLQMGKDPRAAAVDGRSEIGFAAIAITLVDVVVFTPIAFMSGYVGQYFRQFGLVVATATLFSLFISFTLTPLLASRWYRLGQSGDLETERSTWNPMVRFARAWNRGYLWLEGAYRRTLRLSLRHRWTVVLVGLASFAAGIALVATGLLSSEFMPEADTDSFLVTLEMPAGTSLEVTDAAARQIEQRLMAFPETAKVFTSVGVASGFATGQSRFARLAVELKDRRERRRTAQQLLGPAREVGRDIPGAVVKASVPSFVGSGGSAITVRVQGEDQRVLADLATQVAALIRGVPGTTDVSDGGVVGQPELVVSIDRERAADLGLTPAQVAGVLRTGLAGSTVTAFRPEGTVGWDVTVVLDPDDRARVEQVADLPLVTPRGATVKLGQVASFSTVSGPTQIDRRDRQRTVYVTAGLEDRPLGDVVADIRAGLARLAVPPGYRIAIGGQAQDQAESFNQIFQALGLSVVLMYMLMVALFESLLFPLIIMLSLPLAVVGAFGLLALTGNTLNMLSLIGMILLTGLVGKNAILLVDFTNTLRRRGLSRDEALVQAGPTRLRPILMTTATLVLAMLPLALKLGTGSEWRAPMAVTIIGGLLTSTLLTLVLVPSVYTIMDDFQGSLRQAPSWLRALRRRPRPAPSAARVPAPVPAAGGSE